MDVHRPDVIAAVLGDMPTTMEEARCGFRLTLPYALHLEVLLSIEVEHEVAPWLSVIFTHRVKRTGRGKATGYRLPPSRRRTRARGVRGRSSTRVTSAANRAATISRAGSS